MKALTLILGDNEFLASLELERVRARFESKGYAVEEVPASDAQALMYALETMSLFGGGRFVVARGSGQELDAVSDRLAAWASSPPPEVAACLVSTGKASKVRKALGAAADVVEVESPKPWETADWLVRHVKGRGRTIAREAADALVEALGGDLRELASAAEVLMTATSGGITAETVGRFYRGLESQLYTFLDAVLARDRATALRHLKALLRGGEHPLVINLALGKQFRAVAAARDAARKPAPVLAREIDVSAGYVNRAFKAGRNYDTAEVRRAFRLIADADLALKGGVDGEETPDDLLMELLVAELVGERPGPPQRQSARARR